MDTMTATLEDNKARDISTDLWGVFFEDISSSADGGLASELVQNGAFEYSREDREDWSSYTAWRKSLPEGGRAAFAISRNDPLARCNPHYAVVEVARGMARLENLGYDGMVFRAGERYTFSMWTRVHGGISMPVAVSLIGDDGAALANTEISALCGEWKQTIVTLSIPAASSSSDDMPTHPVVAHHGVMRLDFKAEGTIDVDFVSLEPETTYHGLRHFRPDLVRAIAELHPRFMRFPGGCITHGLGLDNMYHWTSTIGPVEQRPHMFNLWGYHQSFRIGYYEYLCLCEAIGAKPLPVLPAGVSCQNTSQGPVPIAQDAMPAYIDEVLALIEFCNGDPHNTAWGARRAALGHPAPFNLEYLGIGNEDLIDDVFKNRFQQIFDAVQAAHPDIVVVGTVGPAPSGKDYERGWEFARKAGVPIVDEHSYQAPSWWFHHLDHYDKTDRQGPKVYLGEYGSWNTMLINALSEAAFMSKMEMNGDVVHMASYAPLLCKNGHNSWNPNLIYFDNEQVYRPYSYWVQRMFSTTATNQAWPVQLKGSTTIHRELSRQIGVQFSGGAKADISEISLDVDGSGRRELPDVHYDGDTVTMDVRACGDAYTLRMRVTYWSGMWGLQIRTGDVHGRNCNTTSLGRRFSVGLVREGCGYTLGGDMESAVDEVRPGTTWDVEIRVTDRGEHAELLVDGSRVAEGREVPDELRRTVTVARDTAAGRDYIRIVNATADPIDVDLSAVLAPLGTKPASAADAEVTVLRGDDPYAGRHGEDSPTAPRTLPVNLSSGVYAAPEWSFSVIVLD